MMQHMSTVQVEHQFVLRDLLIQHLHHGLVFPDLRFLLSVHSNHKLHHHVLDPCPDLEINDLLGQLVVRVDVKIVHPGVGEIGHPGNALRVVLIEEMLLVLGIHNTSDRSEEPFWEGGFKDD